MFQNSKFNKRIQQNKELWGISVPTVRNSRQQKFCQTNRPMFSSRISWQDTLEFEISDVVSCLVLWVIAISCSFQKFYKSCRSKVTFLASRKLKTHTKDILNFETFCHNLSFLQTPLGTKNPKNHEKNRVQYLNIFHSLWSQFLPFMDWSATKIHD